MRQQLITWLIEDIAPEIRRSRDAAGTILKFANERNLAPALVQGLGQLYNTAKTLAFLEKAGSSGRGDSFPILDVDDLVRKFLEDNPVKSAGVAQGTIDHWELDNPDGGGDLPACFAGIMTPAFTQETVINTTPERLAKKAACKKAATALEIEFAIQIRNDYAAEMEKAAGAIAKTLRENPDYTFAQMEADALGYFDGNPRIQGVMDKVAEYCGNCFPRVRVERAKSATQNALLREPADSLMAKIAEVDDGFYKLQACEDFRKESGTTTMEDPALQDAFKAWAFPEGEGGGGGGKGRPEGMTEEFGVSPKTKPSLKPTGDAGGGSSSPRKPGGGVGGAGGPSSLFDSLNRGLDSILGVSGKAMASGAKGLLGGRNTDQELVDTRMQDTRHLSVLQNLMMSDEILSEADPDRIVEIYNTVRTTAPEIAGDINVMRVLLRSAIQHDGIAPFDLKNILETELTKQKVDWNRRLAGDVAYAGAKVQAPNKPM